MEKRGYHHFVLIITLIVLAFFLSFLNPTASFTSNYYSDFITGQQVTTTQPSTRPAPQPLQRVGPAPTGIACDCVIAGSKPYTETTPYTCPGGHKGKVVCTIECKGPCDPVSKKIPSNLPFPGINVQTTKDGVLTNTKCEFICE